MNKDFARRQMIEQQVRAWDVLDGAVLAGLKKVQRELFVPEGFEALAFADTEIPIGHGESMMTPISVLILIERGSKLNDPMNSDFRSTMNALVCSVAVAPL